MRRSARALSVSIAVVAVAVTVGSSVSAAVAADGPYQRPGRTELVTVDSNGGPARYPTANLGCDAHADLSADGHHVVFNSDALNLVDRPGGTSTVSCRDVFWRDMSRKVTKRVNISPGGEPPVFGPQGGGAGGTPPSISADGRFIAFASSAVNLVPGDTNLNQDVFVRDTRTDRTTRVSIGRRGAQSNGASFYPSISGDGRYVAFASNATNLVAGDTNGRSDVFVYDTKSHKTRRASLSSRGAQANLWSGFGGVSINASGRFVAFTSVASNLVPGDTTNEVCQCYAEDVFRRDMVTGRTVRVSVASDGAQASFSAFPSCVVGARPPVTLPEPADSLIGVPQFQICYSWLVNWGGRLISDNGRFVMFASNATNLVPNDSNFGVVGVGGGLDVFVHDVVTRRTERVSVDSYGHENDEPSWLPALSGNGRFAAFATTKEGGTCRYRLVPVDALDAELPCSVYQAIVYDRHSGSADPAFVSMSGASPKRGLCKPLDGDNADGQRRSFGLSRDGRYFAFYSSLQDLAPGDTNNHCDFFVRDRGPVRGAGGFGGEGSSRPEPKPICVSDGVCVPSLDVPAARGPADPRVPGTDLVAARVVHRPGFGDLFVQLDLADMPVVSGTPAGGPLYGLRFAADGQRFEIRVQRTPGAEFDARGGASFGLFGADPVTGVYTKVAALKGGYGTTGPSVVVALPLKKLGQSGGRLSDVRAFSAVGSYLSGATRVLDTVRLSR